MRHVDSLARYAIVYEPAAIVCKQHVNVQRIIQNDLLACKDEGIR